MAAAARTQTIVVAQPTRRAAVRNYFRRGAARRKSKGNGTSPAKARDKQNTQTIAYGGVSAVLFGLLQKNMKLPGIPGVPNSLTYGAGTAAVAIIAKSDKLLKISTGPLFAGLHNIALRGIGGDMLAGEWDETAGEEDETAGESEDVTAGEFDDL